MLLILKAKFLKHWKSEAQKEKISVFSSGNLINFE
jgi:hypothetical protein